MRRGAVGLATGLACLLAAACSGSGTDPGDVSSSPSRPPTPTESASESPRESPAPSASATAVGVPRLSVRRVVRGLSHVWDVAVIDRGEWLLTERDAARLWLVRDGRPSPVDFPSDSVWVSGETGLMSLAVDPGFADNRRFYTCQGGFVAGGHDVRVAAWRLSRDGRRAQPQGTLLGGIPTSSGRHGGCRLLIDRETGAMLVGTGDAAVSSNPRDLTSLGGKVLRLDRRTGAPWPGNPFADADEATQRFVLSYGHRNVQGLAQRDDGTIWSVEHGPDRDDEINLVVPGDFGWSPGPGYDESVPMTDRSLPGRQVPARWSSGFPTVATSGAVWVAGAQWGSLDGTLAVAALKASEVLFLRFDSEGRFVRAIQPQSLQRFGRLRSLTLAANGDLLATTDNGSDDGVLRISPRS